MPAVRDPHKLTAHKAELTFKGIEFANELKALLDKHNAKLNLGFVGKVAAVQVEFHDFPSDLAITLVSVQKGRSVRYFKP